MSRSAHIQRQTSESAVEVTLTLDGTGQGQITTGVPFFDHMLTALTKHSLFDMEVKAVGDVQVDAHHTVEDCAIVLGQALAEALGDKAGITRFGHGLVPLDEALALAVVDISGRGYAQLGGAPPALGHTLVGGHFLGSLADHFFETFALNAGINLHLKVIAGRDAHHIIEAQFKALARALRMAVALDPRVAGVPSTKGTL